MHVPQLSLLIRLLSAGEPISGADGPIPTAQLNTREIHCCHAIGRAELQLDTAEWSFLPVQRSGEMSIGYDCPEVYAWCDELLSSYFASLGDLGQDCAKFASSAAKLREGMSAHAL